MASHREDTVQAESLKSFPDIDSCLCDGFVYIDMTRHKTKIWKDTCDIHGVGTVYFQKLKNKPFGYAGEAKTSRQSWLDYKRKIGEI